MTAPHLVRHYGGVAWSSASRMRSLRQVSAANGLHPSSSRRSISFTHAVSPPQ